MKKFWRGFARFLAVIAAILFVLAAVLALLLAAAERRLMNPATYKNALAQQQVYERLPRVLGEQIVVSLNDNPCTENPLNCPGASRQLLDCAGEKLGVERASILSSGEAQPTRQERSNIQPCLDKYPLPQASASSDPPAFLKSLSAANWETALRIIYPPVDLRRTTENLIDQFFAYLDGRQDNVTLNTVAFKSRLNGQAGIDSLMKLVRGLPACTDQQLNQLSAAMVTGNFTELCQPPQPVVNQLLASLQPVIAAAAAQIPDQRILLPVPGNGSAGKAALSGTLRLARLGMSLSPDLALALLLLVTFLAVRSAQGWLRWWGIPILLAGLLAILMAILSMSLFERSWVSLLANQLPAAVALSTISLLHDLVHTILQTTAAGIVLGGLLLAVLGAGMWIGSLFIKTRPGTPPVPAQ